MPPLPYTEVPAFMAELRALPGLAARALEFTILSAARSGEARKARWCEIDAAARVWAVPGVRMKSGKEHRVPLSDRALAILRRASARGGQRYDLPRPKRGWGSSIRMRWPTRWREPPPWRDRARLPLDVPRLGGGDDSATRTTSSKWRLRTRSRTASRPLTGAA